MSERRPVVGYEGIYEVSEDGKVFRVFVREMKPILTPNGYLTVSLSVGGQDQKCRIHRLVAQAFLENSENLPQVNHKDFNRKNNHVSNLEWCTNQQNLQHAIDNGRRPAKKVVSNKRRKAVKSFKDPKRETRKRHKPIIGTHPVTGEQIEFASSKEAGLHGFHQGSVSDCCRGIHKTHKGYTWRWKTTDPL